MFRRAAAIKARQLSKLKAKAKRANPVNRQSPQQRIESRVDLRSHVERENEIT